MNLWVTMWVKEFLDRLAYDKDAIDQGKEIQILVSSLEASETQVQIDHEHGHNLFSYVCNYETWEALIETLDKLDVKRTHACDVAVAMGLNTREEAVMMAVLLKQMYTVGDCKTLRVKDVVSLLDYGIVSQKLFKDMWALQKNDGNDMLESSLLLA